MNCVKRLGFLIPIGVCVISTAASAGDSGTYEAVGSLATTLTTLEHGDETVIGGGGTGISTITKSSGAPFVEGSSGAVQCISYGTRSRAGFQIEARCTGTYTSSDKVYTVSTRKTGDVTSGSSGEGRIEIVGGTGKFAGITGACQYKIDFLPGNHTVSRSKCEWRRP